jgi:hypothetical protein
VATAPSYANVPVIWSGLVPATADTSWTAPTNVTTLGSAGSAGTKIVQVDVIPAGTVVAGLVNVFAYDGSAYHLLESVPVPAATLSATAGPVKQSFSYDNLALPSGWSLRATVTVAGDVSLVKVTAYGANL